MNAEKSGVSIAMHSLNEELATLGERAEALCKHHLDYVMAANKKRDWDNKSTLYAQTRLRGYGLTANWYEVRWYGSKIAKTRRMSKKLIRKPKSGHSYSTATLANHSQPWEVDLVMEVENGLVEIRRRAFFISKALALLNHLERQEDE